VPTGDLLTLGGLLPRDHRHHAAPWRVHPSRHGGRTNFPEPGPAPGRAHDLSRRREIDEKAEQDWEGYTFRGPLHGPRGHRRRLRGSCACRTALPLNPNGATAQSPDLAFNTSVSFETNTNWQNYSARPGSATSPDADPGGPQLHLRRHGTRGGDRLVRGLTRRSAKTLGNFWVDLTRGVLYILLPIAVVVAIFFVWQGMPQTLNGPATPPRCKAPSRRSRIGTDRVTGSHQGNSATTRRVPERELGASLREPDAAHELVEMILMFAAPFALHVHVRAVRRQPAPRWAIFGAMAGVFLVGSRDRDAQPGWRQPALPSSVDPGPRQHGGVEDPLRLGHRRAVRGSHHEHEHGRDQQFGMTASSDRGP